MFQLDEGTDAKLRNQILTYHMAEILTDRERAALFHLPQGCRMRERAKILAPENFKCGENVWIGEGAILDAQGGLTIGDYTQIGLNVMIWSHTSHRQALAGKTGSKTKSGITFKKTRIGKMCFIAGPSVVAPGITIGDKVIISPMSFIDRDIPDRSVVGGNRDMKKLETRVRELEEKLSKLMEMFLSNSKHAQYKEKK